MINLKLRYTLMQTISSVFAVMSYMWIKDTFHIETGVNIWKTLVGLLVVVSAIYIFHSNYIFYQLAKFALKNDEREKEHDLRAR